MNQTPQNTNPLKQGILIEKSEGIGTVSEQMVYKRACELASMDGRAKDNPSESDLAQATRELTGNSELDPKTELLEAAPESERWDPLAGSTGHKVPALASEDEDEEGRSDSEKLVEEGVAEAQHDQMLQAAKIAEKN
ncbi:MAG: hypothetical protein ABIP97_11965 [Chthoniobacterales bacterium]